MVLWCQYCELELEQYYVLTTKFVVVLSLFLLDGVSSRCTWKIRFSHFLLIINIAIFKYIILWSGLSYNSYDASSVHGSICCGFVICISVGAIAFFDLVQTNITHLPTVLIC